MPNWLTNPLVPQSAIQSTQESLEQPQLDQSPWMARLKGFGSGALEGLRRQTSPLNLAGIAGTALGAGPLLRGGSALAEGAGALSEITPDLVEAGQGIKQVMPTMADTEALTGLLKYGLAKVPQAARTGLDIASEAGKIDPMMAGMGGAALAGLGYYGPKAWQA